MGGAQSKLKTNVWDEADGKLVDPHYCIDGAKPTSKYEVYHLTKRGVNQREFDITDSESNLIYTTRQVPGTISCFDLMGKEMDNYLIRVTVDIARRYWTIYRFEEATFEGQKPDKEATEKLVVERLQEAERDPKVENFNTPFLFRKAVVIVSWSRYMAVSALYGRPTHKMLKDWEDRFFSGQETNGTESAEGETPEAIKAGLIFRANSNDEDSEIDENGVLKTEKFKCQPTEEIALKTQLSDDISLGNESDTNVALDSVELQDVAVDSETISKVTLSTSKSLSELESIDENHSDPSKQTPFSERSTKSAASPDQARGRTSSESTRSKIHSWAKQKSQHLREKSMSALYQSGIISKTVQRDPLEGVLDLNKPLLLCQEIYTRIIGNHQTSRISKKEAIELMKQDIAQHEKDDPEGAKKDEENDPLMTGQEMIIRSRSVDSDLDQGNGEPEHKSVDEEDEVDSNGGSPSRQGNRERDEIGEDEQPLVGYWLWENTLRTHKMKMHIAKGSDLALHVVLAIIANQVRYERNAVAMTI